MAIDWNWPIEFTDGTPAWRYSPYASYAEADAHLVESIECPFGVAMAKGNNGRYSILADANDPRIRNVELGEIRFNDTVGGEPSGGTFIDGGRKLRLFRDTGTLIHTYSWPDLRPVGDSPTISVMNKRQLELEEVKEAEMAKMESNDFYGMF